MRAWRWAACAAALMVSAGGVHAQRVTLQGVVVEDSSRAPVAGVSVAIAERTAVTDAQGRFRFPDLAIGRYALVVSGVDRETHESVIALRADTSIVVTLRVAPVSLDPVTARTRRITVRGQVVEPDRRIGMMDAQVSLQDARAETDLLGRFRFTRMPADVPLSLQVTVFGYLPVQRVVEASRDTTLEIVLAHDSVALRMVAQQLRRISERTEGRRYAGLPELDRDALLAGRDRGTFIDLLQNRVGARALLRVSCIVIDEARVYDSHWQPSLGRLVTERGGRIELSPMVPPLLPDEIYHLEVVELTGMARLLALRIYTRDYMQRMVGGGAELVDRRAATSRVGARCR